MRDDGEGRTMMDVESEARTRPRKFNYLFLVSQSDGHPITTCCFLITKPLRYSKDVLLARELKIPGYLLSVAALLLNMRKSELHRLARSHSQ